MNIKSLNKKCQITCSKWKLKLIRFWTYYKKHEKVIKKDRKLIRTVIGPLIK